MGAVKFEVFLGPGGKVHFKLHNKDGSVALTSKGFQHRDACMEAIRAMREHASAQELYSRKIENGKSSFVLRAPNRQVIVEGGPYEKPEVCEEAITSVRLSSQAAVIDK
jgi:uncharacterized protein YegP (UPF0339 family)